MRRECLLELRSGGERGAEDDLGLFGHAVARDVDGDVALGRVDEDQQAGRSAADAAEGQHLRRVLAHRAEGRVAVTRRNRRLPTHTNTHTTDKRNINTTTSRKRMALQIRRTS